MRLLITSITFILPLFILCQSEREEKLQFRNSTSQKSYSVETETIHKKSERQNNIIYNTNHFRVFNDNSRWIQWGAPLYSYNQFIPSHYYDRFGLRQPSRTYVERDGSRKLVQGVKQHFRFGLSYNTKNQLGGWFTYGNQKFFILEYSSYISSDETSFLPNLTMDKVISWQDKRLDDILLGGTIYMGGGYKFNKIGIHIMPGYYWEIKNYQYFDEFYILSNNGRYSFPNYDKSNFTAKFGVIYDYKTMTLKSEYNPFQNYINTGIGIVF